MARFQGLGTTNPYQQNVNVLSNVAEGSGFAKPLVMKALGEQSRKAQDASVQMSGEQAALRTWEIAAQMAERDPIAANNLLAKEAERNPALAEIAGAFKFSGTGKKPWQMLTNQKTGEVFWFNFDKWMSDGAPEDATPYKKTISGGDKKKTAPKTRTRDIGDNKKITEEWRDNDWVQVGDPVTRYKSDSQAGGIAKVGHINQVRQSIVQHFLDRLPQIEDQELKEAMDEILAADPLTGNVNFTRFLNALDKDVRVEVQSVLAKAERFAAEISPENAAQKAIKEIGEEKFKAIITRIKPTGGTSKLSDKPKGGRKPLDFYFYNKR